MEAQWVGVFHLVCLPRSRCPVDGTITLRRLYAATRTLTMALHCGPLADLAVVLVVVVLAVVRRRSCRPRLRPRSIVAVPLISTIIIQRWQRPPSSAVAVAAAAAATVYQPVWCWCCNVATKQRRDDDDDDTDGPEDDSCSRWR